MVKACYVTERETLRKLVVKTKYDCLRDGWCSKRLWGHLEWECGNI
jgi:hypothetical protein